MCFTVWNQCKLKIMCPVVRMIALRHDAYQNTVLTAANRAEVLHGLCFQFTRPARQHPARPGDVSSRLRGPGCPVPASPPPARPSSRLHSIGKQPGSPSLCRSASPCRDRCQVRAYNTISGVRFSN